MTSLRPFLLALVLLVFPGCAAEDEQRPSVPDAATLAKADYVADEILVRYRDDGTVGAAAAADPGPVPGAKELERIALRGGHTDSAGRARASSGEGAIVIHRLQLPTGLSVPAALETLRNRPELLYAEPNYLVRRAAAAPPNDPFFPKQWGLNNTGQRLHGDRGPITGTPGDDIGILAAWGVAIGDGSTVVAIIDSGIDFSHPDLQDNLWNNPGETGLDNQGRDKRSNGVDDDGNGKIDDWRGWNFVATPQNNTPQDDDIDGHGSHVAGIIGARGNNALGVSGINWQVQLMPLKFLDSQGFGSIADAVAAANYAVVNGARIINASYTHTNGIIFSERDTIAAAGSAGVLFVAAAGNAGTNNDLYPTYPANYSLDNILSVAATDPNDNRASFSNYGTISVDLGAPGVNIYSTVRQVLTGLDGQAGYDYISGTSMAAPHVAGAAALLWNHYPNLSYLDIRKLLIDTVDPVPAMTMTASGGRLNLGRALTVDLSQAAPVPPSNLSVQQVAANAVTLGWVDNAGTETNFIVERTVNGSYVPLARLAADSVSYTDSTPPDGRTASYRVKAVTDYSSSPYITTDLITVPLLPPSGLSAIATATGSIDLSWRDNTDWEERYELERRAADEASFNLIFTGGVSSTGYSDISTSLGTTYYYRVRAYNTTSGYSAYSAETAGFRPPPSSGGGGGGCFIATAAWGSKWTQEVTTLRRFRDRVLLPTAPGRFFVKTYYRFSPPLARAIAEHDSLRTTARWLLTPLVWLAEWVSPEASAMDRVPPQPPAPTQKTNEVPGELLVKFLTDTPPARVEQIVAAASCTILERLPVQAGEVLRIGLPASLSVKEGLSYFSAQKEILYAEPNRRVGINLPGRPAP